MERYNYEYIKRFFEENGCKLLSTEYKSCSKKLLYEAKCGHRHDITFDSFKNSDSGRLCPSCSHREGFKKQSLSYTDVLRLFSEKGCTLISDRYDNNRTPLQYICVCGRKTTKNLGAFKRNHLCKHCIKENKNSSSKKHSIEYVKKVFANNGCCLLEEVYINSKTKMKCVCKCGKIKYLRFDNVAKGSHCRECSYKKTAKALCKYTIEDVRKAFYESGCELLSDTYNTTNDVLNYKCVCGNKSEIRFSTFLLGARCMNCAIENRVGENNYQWKPDKTDEERLKGRKFREYAIWRRRVFERDNYTCGCCRQYGGGLSAHHLDGWHWCVEKRLDVDNGVTLCNECHNDFHTEFGKRDNTKEQYVFWLKHRQSK